MKSHKAAAHGYKNPLTRLAHGPVDGPWYCPTCMMCFHTRPKTSAPPTLLY